MAKKEVKTDLWVNKLLEDAGIKLDAQGCDIKEIDDALKTASKSGTGNPGYPEYCGVVKDYVLVIEDKPSVSNHVRYNEDGIVSKKTKDVRQYAVNGAVFYAQHI